jgi:hypothetical protein
MLGDVQSLLGSGDGNVLLLYLCVDHAGFKLVIDWSICGDSFFIKLLFVLASSSQILKLRLI